MGFMNAMRSGFGGGAIGSLAGGLGGLVLGGPFGMLPGMMMGGSLGAMGGGLYGMFKPDYQQMNQAYNPGMMGYGQMGNYGGFQMPAGMMSTVPMQQSGPGFGTGMLAGAATMGMAGLAMSAFSWPMYGMGWGMGGLGMMGMGGLGMMGMGMGLGIPGVGLGGMFW